MTARVQGLTLALCLALCAGRVPAAALSQVAIDVNGVREVVFRVPGDLSIEQAASDELTIQAEPAVLSKLNARVRGERLHLEVRESLRTEHPIRLTLRLRELAFLSNESSGNVRIDTLSQATLRVKAVGSGDVVIAALRADRLELLLSGSGDVSVRGTVLDVDVQHSGSGDFDGASLRAASVQVLHEGSGDVSVGRVDRLDAVLQGSGDVRTVGTPRLLHVAPGGTGELLAD